MTAIPNILLPSILALRLKRTRLSMVLVETFCIGIFHELLELPGDVRLHLRIKLGIFFLEIHTLGIFF